MSDKERIRQLESEIEQLETENRQLVSRNLQLSEQLCAWYELRQRVSWLKEEMLNRQQLQKREQKPELLTGDFSVVELSELLGVSQRRLIQLFRHTPIYKSVDDYLDNLRTLRGIQLLREHPEYGIASVSEEAGFNSVRTFQRHMQEAVGMTPVEFRMMVEKER